MSERTTFMGLADAYVEVRFSNRNARSKFRKAWIGRSGGLPADRIVDGMQIVGANAERALDLANEIVGVVAKWVTR